MKGKVLMFHRVLPESEITFPNAYWDRGTLISLSRFVAVLNRLSATNSQVFSLRDFWERQTQGLATDRDVALTFDDGYEDNYRIVFPLLKKYNFKASFFPVVQPVVNGENLLLDDYYATIDSEKMSSIERRDWINGLKKEAFVRASKSGKNEYINNLSSENKKQPKSNRLYLQLSQLKEMESAGMEVGGHSITHPRLTDCTKLDQEKEIFQNIRWLNQHFANKKFSFCYPDGNYDKRVKNIVNMAGFYCAATTNKTGFGPWEIPRLFVDSKFEIDILV